MALKLNQNKTVSHVAVEAAQAKAEQAEKPATVTQVSKPAAQAAKQETTQAAPKASFLKTGKTAKETFDQEEAKAQANKDRPFRFFLKNGGETSITFLDGDLDADGALEIPYYYEHFEKIAGRVQTFPCLQDSEPCPLCESGNSPSFVGVMTIIDHTEFKDKEGNMKKDQVRLFVAKRGTIKQLQKLAAKRGGLRGCRFDVSRTGDKEPGVGNVFDFTEKLTDAMLVKHYGDKSKPLVYDEKTLGFMDAVNLRKLGFGNKQAPVGAEAPLNEEDFSKEL